MHKVLLAAFTFFFIGPATAQRSEVGLVLQSGLCSYTGPSSAGTSVINTSHTYNPYGRQNGLCDGAALHFKRISKIGLIIALESGIETLRSKVAINLSDNSGSTAAADGTSTLSTSFLYLTPFTGYRLSVKGVSIDVLAGFDLAYLLKLVEHGKATDINGRGYRTISSPHGPTSDVRFRLQIAVSYRRFGIYAGYCIGLSDYLHSDAYDTPRCMSRLTRFGISYRLNQIEVQESK